MFTTILTVTVVSCHQRRNDSDPTLGYDRHMDRQVWVSRVHIPFSSGYMTESYQGSTLPESLGEKALEHIGAFY